MSKPLTQEEFLNNVNKVHGNRYDYSKVKYVNARTKITIICKKHGEFEQLANSHSQGANCIKCTNYQQTKTTQQFIIEAKKVHGEKYNYSKTKYLQKNKPLTIRCRDHGYFEQVANIHLKGSGCKECSLIETKIKKNKKSKKRFVEQIKNLKTNLIIFSEDYIDSTTKIRVECKKHGIFKTLPHGALRGDECKKCMSKRFSIGLKKFKSRAIKVHKNKYNYSEVDYINIESKVKIICPIHGEFKQIPNSHLKGHGCEKCNLTSYWTRSKYIKKAKGRVCIFYTIRCFNQEEEFYKIGITMRSVKERYYSSAMPYEYEVISEVKGSAGFIWDLEKEKKIKLKDFKYSPKIYFGGSKTECFTKYNIEGQ
jgi:hypothetical protein